MGTKAFYNLRMKRWLFSLLFMLSFSLQGHAEEDFSIEKIAIDFGLKVVSHGTPWTFSGINHLYTNKSLDRAIMVVDEVPGNRTESRIIHDGSKIIFEFPVSQEAYTSVLFYNLDKDRLLPYLTKNYRPVVQFFRSLKNLFISSAHAGVDNCGGASPRNAMGKSLNPLLKQYATDYIELSTSCFMGAMEGVWDSTGGMVMSALKGIKNLAQDPKKFWNDKVEDLKRLKNFFLDFETNVQNMVAGFKKLPNATKAQILCSFIGSLGTDALITILTAGAGSAKLALTMKNFLSKIVKIENLLTKLSKVGKLAELPKEFFNKLAKGKILEKHLNSLKSLSSHGLDDYALQLAKCSI